LPEKKISSSKREELRNNIIYHYFSDIQAKTKTPYLVVIKDDVEDLVDLIAQKSENLNELTK
jgi:hypothetical protein